MAPIKEHLVTATSRAILVLRARILPRRHSPEEIMAKPRPKQRPKPHPTPRPVAPPAKPANKPAKPIPPDDDSLLSIAQFCQSEGISRRTLDALRQRRDSPKFFRIGHQLRITKAERERWRQRMAKQTQ